MSLPFNARQISDVKVLQFTATISIQRINDFIPDHCSIGYMNDRVVYLEDDVLDTTLSAEVDDYLVLSYGELSVWPPRSFELNFERLG